MKNLKITVISEGIPHEFKDPEYIMIQSEEGICFDSRTEDFLQIYSWPQRADNKPDI